MSAVTRDQAAKNRLATLAPSASFAVTEQDPLDPKNGYVVEPKRSSSLFKDLNIQTQSSEGLHYMKRRYTVGPGAKEDPAPSRHPGEHQVAAHRGKD